MFKKVLIAEDQDFMNISLRATLKELGIIQDNRDYVSYCDDAFNRVKKAIQEANPYELLITDLSFLEDSRKQEISSGIELIKAVKEIQPNIKVLVFSVDHRRSMANSLFLDLGIDGYVPKTRGAAADFKLAIVDIFQDKKYYSLNLLQDTKSQHSYKFTDLERTIVSLLSQGKSQKEIASHLGKSLSSVEKCLGQLKAVLHMTTTVQLIAHSKEHKII